VKILILALNYSPELIGVGKYTGELAEWLTARGHSVRVVTAPPYYPAWRVGPGHASWRYQAEEIGRAEVLRCPLWVPKAPSALKRIMHLASFALSSAVPALWRALAWRPDVVWTVEPTIFSAPVALLAARLCGARACLHVQDLELEAALQLGMISRPRLGGALRALHGGLLRRFDLVSTICQRMRSRLVELGVADERLCLLPNWVDTVDICPLERNGAMRRALGLRDDQVIALYAGNMGEKQGLEMLADVARRLIDQPEVHLVLCGDGAARGELERRLEGFPNVTLLPLQPRERLNDLLNMADIHVLPQRAEAEHFALPSKLGGMLASGRPVVAQTTGGELARAARDCGVATAPGDAAAMARAIADLAADAGRRRRLGRVARRLAEAWLERDVVLARYESRLHELTGRWLRAPAARTRVTAPGAMGQANAGLAPGTRLSGALRP
jgi:colanic acid biosynthesis glycosyl transferase WcaI